jgi:hypothetical protein
MFEAGRCLMRFSSVVTWRIWGENLDLLTADGDKDDQEVDDDFIESVERIATANYPFTAEAKARLVQSDGRYPIPEV